MSLFVVSLCRTFDDKNEIDSQDDDNLQLNKFNWTVGIFDYFLLYSNSNFKILV